MHPAKEGFAALPFFDEFDLSTVDVLLISQYVRSPFLRSVLYSAPIISMRREGYPWVCCRSCVGARPPTQTAITGGGSIFSNHGPRSAACISENQYKVFSLCFFSCVLRTLLYSRTPVGVMRCYLPSHPLPPYMGLILSCRDNG